MRDHLVKSHYPLPPQWVLGTGDFGAADARPWFVVSCGSAGEPAEMFGQSGHRYSRPGCLTQHFQDRLAGGTVDPDVRGAFRKSFGRGLGQRHAISSRVSCVTRHSSTSRSSWSIASSRRVVLPTPVPSSRPPARSHPVKTVFGSGPTRLTS